jgi:hypothetical protein
MRFEGCAYAVRPLRGRFRGHFGGRISYPARRLTVTYLKPRYWCPLTGANRSATAGNLLGVIAQTPRYTPWHREAVYEAYAWATAGHVTELAASGLLEHPSGARLGPCSIPENTVRSIARRERLRRAAAQDAVALVDQPPRDAVERLRRRFVTALDGEMTRIEIEQMEGRQVTGEALRQVARALRELASIPGPNDPRPPVPGAKVNGARDGSETRGGLAGKILAAHRAG